MEIEAVAELEVEMEQIGPQGYSAYEVYVQNGGTLSETKWLASLKGKDGQNGSNGLNGTDGQDGITPSIGDNGNWYLGDTDTGKPSRGKEGPQGPAGKDGTSGVSIEEVTAITGNLENLNTEDKSNLVNAINESLNSGSGSAGGIVINADNAVALGKDETKSLFKIWYDNYINDINIPIILNTVVRDDSFKNHSFMLVNIVNDSTFQRYTLTFLTLQNTTSMDTIFTADIRVTYNNKEFANISFNNNNGYIQCSKFTFAKTTNVLTKTNSTAYTPTGDYNPATKKYVDDAIAALKAELTGGQ